MEIIKIAAVVIVVVILVNSIPTYSKEISILITFSGCVILMLYIVNTATPAVEQIKSLVEKISFNNMDVVLKAVGIGFITQFVSDIAMDCNNKSLANQMIFAGRICVLMLSMPVFLEIFEIIEQLTKQI